MDRVASNIKKIKFRCFYHNWSPEYRLFFEPVAKDPVHPLHAATKRKYNQKEESGLWWYIVLTTGCSKTRVVRSWLKRRLENAVADELKARGFDGNGKAIRPGNGNQNSEQSHILSTLGDLHGSFRLVPLPELVTTKYEQVRAETGRFLDAIIRGQQQNTFNNVGCGWANREKLSYRPKAWKNPNVPCRGKF